VGELRLGDTDLAQAETILIAVNDGVLADSLRFSLELEGFETRLCDQHSLFPAMSAAQADGCLVLDQDVFTQVMEAENGHDFGARGLPVVLMVSHSTKRVLARAEAAGVTEVVEKPLLGSVLFDAIRQAIRGRGDLHPLPPPTVTAPPTT
jgi:FixJ family two-component response regulator